MNAGSPRVALESTLITHGLAWPRNLEAARLAEAAVRASGAEPATIGILGGEVVVGLSDAQLEHLARAERPMKASRGTLALALESGGSAGTTVSATMLLAARAGIAVFATGGIGGVHRGGASSFDVSSDLDELARTAVLVVCSGPKSILDVDLTLEYLETRGVPVVGWKTLELAGFYAVGSGRMLAGLVDGAAEAAALAERHWGLGLASGLVVAVPVPAEAALAREVADGAIDRAVAEAAAAGVRGPASTPWILARIAELTDGRSIDANLALIEKNARVAGEIAVALAAPEAKRA
jgi:pseudouridine-5'-phosphate glycosidase